VVLKTWMPLNNFPGFGTASGPSGADCWGYTSPSGREYALMGLSWGNGIVEVTDPSNPVVVTTIPGSVNSLWRDITVIGHYAYAVSDSSGVGIQVMDLSNIDTGSVTLVRNLMQGGHTTTHSMVANTDSGYLYLQGGNAAGGGMVPANCNIDPTMPTFTGPGWTNQYVHEAQMITYPAGSGPYAGKEIAFNFAAGPYYGSSYTRCMSIVDITNKAAPVTLSFIAYPGMGFCHQGWISEDRKYLYVDDELDAPDFGNVPRFTTRVFDVTDLAAPRMVATFSNGLPSVDHNQYTKGRYLYQSNYTTGLRVWDISSPLKPVEVAWFDTRPEDNGTGYQGAWGNYPYFNSGTILISDLQRGMFMVKLSLLELSPSAPPPAALVPGQATPVSVHVNEMEATIGDVAVMVSINGGSYTPHTMVAAGGGLYSGELPAAACNDRVRYYFRARTSESTPRAFTWPVGAGAGDVLRSVSEGGEVSLFTDDFETDKAWTVQNTGLTSGAWVRATPLHDGGPGAVVGDADGSGKCFVTGNTLNERVAGGTTRLVSPTLDLSGNPEAAVSVSRWFLSIVATTDFLVTEVSGNNGSTWTVVDSIGPSSGGWQPLTFRVADFVAPTAQVRVRFSVTNTDESVTEAGIDAFSVVSPTCVVPCYANCDGSTVQPVLNVSDFTCFLNMYAAADPYANCDNSTTPPILNVNDFICFTNAYAAGCP